MKPTFPSPTCLALLAAASLTLCGSTLAGHPQMDAAIQNLLAARAELQKASGGKGGERVAALSAIDRALAKARADVEYRNDKPRKQGR